VDLPVDRELDLCSGFTLGTVTAIARLCAMLAFATARATFREFHEWAPSSRATLRMVDAVGGEARAFLDAAAAPDDDGEVLVIQVDGRGAPMITATERERRARPHGRKEGTGRHRRRDRRRLHPRPRRQQGDKSKNAKVAFVGVLYTLRRTSEGVEGPINKRLIATFESHDALFRWLREHADRRGHGRKRTLFLADGSEHIWRCQAQYFPDAESCIDWYHVVEKLWEAGGCIHEAGSDELQGWMAQQTARLRRGHVAAVLADLSRQRLAIAKTGPGNKGRRERLAKVTKYLTDHAHRMPYAELRRDDLEIGTGAVEGAVRNLVGLRLDGPGKRWGRERSELVMHLRGILLNVPVGRLPPLPGTVAPQARAAASTGSASRRGTPAGSVNGRASVRNGGSAPASTSAQASPEEAGDQGVEALGDGQAGVHVGRLGVTDEAGGFERCEGLEAFSSRDGEGAVLVSAADTTGAFRDVEDRALRGTEGFVPQLRVTNVRGLDGEQELDGDVIGDEPVVRELRRRVLVGHAPSGAGSVTPRSGGAVPGPHGLTNQHALGPRPAPV